MTNSKSKSTSGIKNIPDRENVFKNADMWLKDKRMQDGAEGLWRVYDDLFDVTEFVEQHPGGKFWLEATKGMDITEAFESHHISTIPEDTIKKYFVRKAKVPRNSPFTFEENGFYKTLKRNVRESLKTIPKNGITTTKILIDTFLIGSFLFAILASKFWSFKLATISGFLVAFTTVAAHNYYHQRDNFRMYYSNIGLMMSREWRILHILSHHLFPNTVADMQAYVIEPMINFYPEKKSFWKKYASWIYTPLILFPVIFYYLYVVRICQWIFLGYSQSVSRSDFLPATLPLAMYIFGGQPLLSVIGMWLYIISVHSTWFTVVGIAGLHYHPDIFMDGDEPRPKHERDWGIIQLDTVSDRYEFTGNTFLSLITFGDHALHHLFPTLDHGVLQHLYPVTKETMKQFNLDIRMNKYSYVLGGFFRQLANDTPNINPPDLLKNKKNKIKSCG